MLHPFNLNGRDGGAGNPRQEGAAQGITERVAEARLKRLDNELGAHVCYELLFNLRTLND